MSDVSSTSMFFHKQLPSRTPWFDNHYTWCLRDSRNLSLASSWSGVKCSECLRIKKFALKHSFHPLHAWALVEERIFPTIKVSKPNDVMSLLVDFVEKEQEYFIVITLNGANMVLNSHVISIGLLDQTQVHPREVFVQAIKDRAKSVILAHNHPSSQNEPSPEDLAITKQLVDAGGVIGIEVLDHVIFSQAGMYSFLEHGEL